MVDVRLYIDSVWEDDVVTLISVDGETETVVKFEKDALANLLEGRRGFFETKTIVRKRVESTVTKLRRNIEGKAVRFSTLERPFFLRIMLEFGGPNGALVSSDDIIRLR